MDVDNINLPPTSLGAANNNNTTNQPIPNAGAAGDTSPSSRSGQKGFAQSLIFKYSWMSGSRLGAESSGIINPLQVKVKSGVSGRTPGEATMRARRTGPELSAARRRLKTHLHRARPLRIMQASLAPCPRSSLRYSCPGRGAARAAARGRRVLSGSWYALRY